MLCTVKHHLLLLESAEDPPELLAEENKCDEGISRPTVQLSYGEPCPLQAPPLFLGGLLWEMHCQWLSLNCVSEGFTDAPQGMPLLHVIAPHSLAGGEQGLCDSPGQVRV